MMDQTQSNTQTPASFEQIEQLGTVELDRYCTGCGYNLRQQAVRREPATKLLMCKCPECGMFEPANNLTTATRSWSRLVAVVAWIFWLLIWLNLVGWSVFCVTALAVISGDIRRTWLGLEDVDQNQIIDQNNLINSNSYYSDTVYGLSPLRGEHVFILAIFIALAIAIGAVLTTITAVAMPHWRRWGYVCFASGWPLIGIFLFHGLAWREIYGWHLVTADLLHWHLYCAIAIEGSALAASLLAVWMGRPITRGIVRIVIPPKRRGVFAYLWLVDGKDPPKTQSADQVLD
ncbi:MAG: hypothetical protein AB8C95_13835 [Phycisphaeraceae bacterium]